MKIITESKKDQNTYYNRESNLQSEQIWRKELFLLSPSKVSTVSSWSGNSVLIEFQDFDKRKEEVIAQLLNAAEYAGFFTLVDHGISKEEIEAQFAISKAFFDLPPEDKAKTPHNPKTNNGWEYKVGGHWLTGEVSVMLILLYRLNCAPAPAPTTRRNPSGCNVTRTGLAMGMSLNLGSPRVNSWVNVLVFQTKFVCFSTWK